MGAIKSPVCKQGHALKDPNVYYRKDGGRECLACKKQRNLAWVRPKVEVRKKRADAGKPRTPRPMTIKQRILAKGGE